MILIANRAVFILLKDLTINFYKDRISIYIDICGKLMKLKCCKNKKAKSELKKTDNFLKAISEENRLLILCLLKKGEMCVCEIWQYLDLPQNLVSHHLKVLKDFGLIKSRRESTKIIYSLNQKNSKKFISLLSHFIK